MAKSKLIAANKKIERGVVDGYKKLENVVINGFNEISDKFVDNYLTRERESVKAAKKRLADDQKERDQKRDWKLKKRKERQQQMIEKSRVAGSPLNESQKKENN